MLCAEHVVDSGRRLQASIESASKLVDVEALEMLVLVTEVSASQCQSVRCCL